MAPSDTVHNVGGVDSLALRVDDVSCEAGKITSVIFDMRRDGGVKITILSKNEGGRRTATAQCELDTEQWNAIQEHVPRT